MFERYTAFFHLRAVAAQGALGGVLLLNEYIARKELGATRWQILALLVIPAGAQMMVVFWNPATGRGPFGRRPFRTLGIALHALLFLPLLTGGRWSAWAFVGLGVTVLVAQMLLVPIQNRIVARNYGATSRGRRFGRAAAVQSLVIVAVSVPVGFWMDHDPGAWPWAYAFAAIAAMFAYRQWSLLKQRVPTLRFKPSSRTPRVPAIRLTDSTKSMPQRGKRWGRAPWAAQWRRGKTRRCSSSQSFTASWAMRSRLSK